MNADGTMNFDGVAPGEYTLRVTANRTDGDDFGSRPIATGEITVTIPQGADPFSPIHIDEVVLKPAK